LHQAALLFSKDKKCYKKQSPESLEVMQGAKQCSHANKIQHQNKGVGKKIKNVI